LQRLSFTVFDFSILIIFPFVKDIQPVQLLVNLFKNQ